MPTLRAGPGDLGLCICQSPHVLPVPKEGPDSTSWARPGGLVHGVSAQ